MPVRIWLVALCAWVALSTAGLGVLAARAYQEQKAAFERRSDSLYALIRQRLDQNEAVLSGLEAAVSGAAPWQFERVWPYTRQIMARYPHIHSVGLQPRIERAMLARFERYAKQAIAPGYQITDSVFDTAGKPSFRRAAVRPFYYPVVFMEPPAPEASFS